MRGTHGVIPDFIHPYMTSMLHIMVLDLDTEYTITDFTADTEAMDITVMAGTAVIEDMLIAALGEVRLA